MVYRVFLTGRPGIGKTTVVLETVKLLSRSGIRIGGMVSFEVRESGVRVGFKVRDIYTGLEGWLAHVSFTSGPRIGRYRVNIDEFESIGVKAILDALNDNSIEVIVVDEIGPMELLSRKFRDAIYRLLDSGKNVLGTIHYRCDDPLARRIRSMSGVEIVEVTLDNRNRLPSIFYDRLSRSRYPSFNY
ncbi:MAG: NTPase [Nitrososphaerota archaeon]|nr:NTPase [Candidatus Bathyarchaeota archaeon]MCX8162242.1 NTPase [Candidatus Bathyarchaeota archaeon]MDW8061694.1 NTPase [Nitrososphaerota archaeon]